MSVFRWVLLSLTAFRLTRLLTTDVYPPTEWFREKALSALGPKWGEIVSCPWCASPYIVGIVYAVDNFLWTIPTILLAAGATMAVVGYLATYDES